MSIGILQHINLRCDNVERSCLFYTGLGFVVGPRPPFESEGYWLYVDDKPAMHLVQKRPDEPLAAGTGAIDHIAFAADDLAATRALLVDRELPYREALVPRDNFVQLLVRDPDGVQIELNFAQVDELPLHT